MGVALPFTHKAEAAGSNISTNIRTTAPTAPGWVTAAALLGAEDYYEVHGMRPALHAACQYPPDAHPCSPVYACFAVWCGCGLVHNSAHNHALLTLVWSAGGVGWWVMAVTAGDCRLTWLGLERPTTSMHINGWCDIQIYMVLWGRGG
jgi:hypothetical protein